MQDKWRYIEVTYYQVDDPRERWHAVVTEAGSPGIALAQAADSVKRAHPNAGGIEEFMHRVITPDKAQAIMVEMERGTWRGWTFPGADGMAAQDLDSGTVPDDVHHHYPWAIGENYADVYLDDDGSVFALDVPDGQLLGVLYHAAWRCGRLGRDPHCIYVVGSDDALGVDDIVEEEALQAAAKGDGQAFARLTRAPHVSRAARRV